MWLPSNEEILAVSRLAAGDRVSYSIKKIVDEDKLWGLWLNGWCIYAGDAGRECLGVWPHSRYAELCRTGEFSEARPREISLSDWLDKWIPGMTRDNRSVTVFPTEKDKGCVISAKEMEQMLKEEIERV